MLLYKQHNIFIFQDAAVQAACYFYISEYCCYLNSMPGMKSCQVVYVDISRSRCPHIISVCATLDNIKS